MSRDLKHFFGMCWPLLAAIAVFLLNLQIETVTSTRTVIELPLFTGVSVAVPSPLGARLLVNVLGGFFLCVLAFRDYSPYFENLWKVDVHFESEKIREALGVFSKRELEGLNLHPNWPDERPAVLRDLTDKVLAKDGMGEEDARIRFRFYAEGSRIHSSGHAILIIKKVHGSLQEYEVRQSWGELKHEMDTPGKPTEHLFTKFKLMGGTHRIVLKLHELVTGTVVMRPTYRQIVSLPNQEVYETEFEAVTKVRFFPVRRIHDTVHLAASPDGRMVPVSCIVNTTFG